MKTRDILREIQDLRTMMASTTTQKPSAVENVPGEVKGMNKKLDLTRQNQHQNRRTLQTIQYSTGGPISPIRKIVKPQKKNLIQKIQKPITVFCDPPQKRLDDKASQTEKAQNGGNSEAYNMLVSEEVPESYWKDLAEERRKALDESLHENEQLHKEVSDLKEENEKLSKVANQAEYFANVLKEVLGAEDEEEKQNVLNSTHSDEDSDKSNTEDNTEDSEKLGSDQLLLDNNDDKQDSNPEGRLLQSESNEKQSDETSVKTEKDDKTSSDTDQSEPPAEKNLSHES